MKGEIIMSDKLKSRKLWVFIALVLLTVVNYLFGLGMPPSDVMYLVILGASYILGQGYVDAKQQKVDVLPSEDLTNSVTNIIQAEIQKLGFGKNLPMEQIIDVLKPILQQEIARLSVSLSYQTPDPVTDPDPDPIPVDPVQQSV